MPIPTHYKETGKWLSTNTPTSLSNPNSAWWNLYHDKTLSELENKVTCNNQNLKIALARYQEACALASVARSMLYPTITGVGNAARQHASLTVANPNQTDPTYNAFFLGSQITYEIDAWGRVRNAVIASDSLARASAYDLAAINLSLHAELANDYFQLRGADAAQRVLDATVIAYEKALHLTRMRYQGGASASIDVYQAQTQLENAKTLATDMRLKRAQLEHAIAVLVGEIPANFTLPPLQSNDQLLNITPDLPSALLMRRPDVAAAIERVRSANASIGVARAAFFPDFNLTALIAAQSGQLSNLFSASSLFWSLGPSTTLALVQPIANVVIFDGYKLQALLKHAKASYFEAVSTYRQTVLTAFQQVEDNLIAIRRLDEEGLSQTASTLAAKKALFQANKRYDGGIATYLDVIVTENEALQSKLSLITIRTHRQIASVQLIKALGGGWCYSPSV